MYEGVDDQDDEACVEDTCNEVKDGGPDEDMGKVLNDDDGGEGSGGDIQDDASDASSGNGIASGGDSSEGVGEAGARDGPNAGNVEVCVLSYGTCGGMRMECHNS